MKHANQKYRKLWYLELALAGLLLVPQLALAQTPTPGGQPLGGYVRLNALEKQITPSAVFQGQGFQAQMRINFTILKDLPLNIAVEGEFQVLARQPGQTQWWKVGQDKRQIGPLPSVKAGATIELSETLDLAFPFETPPGTYHLFMEPIALKPWVAWFALEAVPSLQSVELGTVQYLGSRPKASDLNLRISAPPEATAAMPLPLEIEAEMPGADQLILRLSFQVPGGDSLGAWEYSLSVPGQLKAQILAPDWEGEIKLVAQVIGYRVAGQDFNLPAPHLSNAIINLKKRPWIASGKIDLTGVVREPISIASADGRARLEISPGTRALSPKRDALNQVKIEAVTATLPTSGYSLIGQAYNFGPEGVSFEPPAKIVLHYNRSRLPLGVKESSLALAWLSAGKWEKIPSKLNQQEQTLVAEIDHLSIFAILGQVTRPNYWGLVVAGALGAVALFWGWRLAARH